MEVAFNPSLIWGQPALCTWCRAFWCHQCGIQCHAGTSIIMVPIVGVVDVSLYPQFHRKKRKKGRSQSSSSQRKQSTSSQHQSQAQSDNPGLRDMSIPVSRHSPDCHDRNIQLHSTLETFKVAQEFIQMMAPDPVKRDLALLSS